MSVTRLAIVGGALQGMEAVYLAGKAGYTSVVMDRKTSAPALSLCDEPIVLDPTKDPEAAKKVLEGCDAVIPACEEMELLTALGPIAHDAGIPLLFDMDAYRISCSKQRSNEIMASVGTPLPKPWPSCGFPVIVKPSSQSGSVGVSVAMDESDLEKGLKAVSALNDTPIVQEFVHGKSVSIEVIGDGREARPYVTTEVVLDSNYDCKMVICDPDILGEEDEAEFARIGKDVGEALNLKALMDVEAILTPNGLRVLEIDARIPSQTPAAICMATGVNLLKELTGSALGKGFDGRRGEGSSAYYHLVCKDGILRACGEKEFGHVRSPRIVHGLFGSDDAITDYEPGKDEWRITMISRGRDREEVMSRFDRSISKIADECGIDRFIDRSPEVVR